MSELIPFCDIERMGEAIASSGLFGIQTPAQAIALMLVAQAEGRHPATAARDYHIIKGRPALKADAILARFQEAGGKVEWHQYAVDVVDATFSHPAGGSLRLSWTLADAKAANIGGRDIWKQYPRAMLRARLISEGVRTVYPAVLCGFYTPEEVGDFHTEPQRATARADEGPDPAAVRTAELSALRKELNAEFARIGFDRDGKVEWISGNYPDPAAAMGSPYSIMEMIELLKKVPVGAPAQKIGDEVPC
jgi:hypothetical protein